MINSQRRGSPNFTIKPNVIAGTAPRALGTLMIFIFPAIYFFLKAPLTSIFRVPIVQIGIVSFIILFLGVFFVSYMNLKNREYRFFNNEVEVYEGFINITQDNISYNRVTDISFDRPVWQRIFGTGTIRLNTAGSGVHEIHISYVNNPEDEYNRIRDLIWGGEQPRSQGTQAPPNRRGGSQNPRRGVQQGNYR